ncbi:sigma-54-dependent transcriptional regulator [Paraburkholderia flava]|uniref:sigma-54-dependent transcriptional regulator n=1 Tax=Paraburkholderia flava TaxID=2547393 RepID=UPI0010600F74|nr:sigma-54 dependent transcriptional regulator [Paraburkholderia flava]
MNEPLAIRVIFVDDEADVRLGSTQALELAGFEVDGFETVESARACIRHGAPLVVLCDVKLPGMPGNVWLNEIRAIDPDLPVILITGHGDISMAVKAIREGAYDFIEKPYSSDHLVAVVRRAVEKRQLMLQMQALRDQIENFHGIEGAILGVSVQMQRLRTTLLRLADMAADVVIYGETGTGKDLVARCLHDYSDRRHANYVPLNCGGMSESLAESELFGHEAGSFTGATHARVGKFEHANGGTLFLDEIESMPIAVQIKFLRALQERSIERVGSNRQIAVDCRVIAAAKEDLKVLSDQQKFRLDLYYRLGVAFIELPPLRERREDIPLLFEHFTLLAANRFKLSAPVLDRAQLAELMSYNWPGNVRELRNTADRFVLGLINERLTSAAGRYGVLGSLSEQVEQFERVMIGEEMKRHQGNTALAAKALGLPKQTLYDKLRKLRIVPEEFR